MKKNILIAGTGSNIGDSFCRYMALHAQDAVCTCLDMTDPAWREHDFSADHVVYMVAGIAHMKETTANRELYYHVNRDLAVELAKRAKAAGVGQFIYLSSMSVYGKDTGVITNFTELKPGSSYACSKAQAEELLSRLRCDTFRVAILRPPMVYGRGCKGNYRSLEKLALTLPFFPKIRNQRSMIYIDNLSACVRAVIEQEVDGCCCPQNDEYVCTYDLVRQIAHANGRRIVPGVVSGFLLSVLGRFFAVTRKAFGTLIYQGTVGIPVSYHAISLEESIQAMYSREKAQQEP